MPRHTDKNHRRFNAHRFVHKFAGGFEPLLLEFLRRVAPAHELALQEAVTVEEFLDLLALRRDSNADLNAVHRLLHDTYDLADLQGAFFIREAAKQMGVILQVPPGPIIPEHLSLLTLCRHEEVFLAAFDRLDLAKTNNFAFFRGRGTRSIDDAPAAAAAFAATMCELKKNQNVVVRPFRDGEMVNFIFDHEKPPRAPLVFKAPQTIAALVHRPVDQDFVSYNTVTGHVEFEIGNRGERADIRRRFAAACFGDEDYFDERGSTAFLDLDRLLRSDQQLSAYGVTLTSLEVRLPQPFPHDDAVVAIDSGDVLSTLAWTGWAATLATAEQASNGPPVAECFAEEVGACSESVVRSAKLRLKIPDVRRPAVVTLVAPNKISFPRRRRIPLGSIKTRPHARRPPFHRRNTAHLLYQLVAPTVTTS
ncbi:MAG: hypothetical protein ACREIA_24810 [Opitutaceae bacterium]